MHGSLRCCITLPLSFLEQSYYALNRKAAPGIDGVTWQGLRREPQGEPTGTARPDTPRELPCPTGPTDHGPEGDGTQRPLSILCLEDKIVQQAVVYVLEAIYEEDFVGFSYGFRPGRGPHDALDALHAGIYRRRVNWVLDLDVRGFFDAMSHQWTVRFLQHRIGDKRLLRLIVKWLKVGVVERGSGRTR